MKNLASKTKRVFIGLIGTLVLLVGIIAIPYPGPGWLIVFSGLMILATEFDWAKRLHDWVRRHYDAWYAWIGRQSIAVRSVFWLLTALIVVLTIWIMNGYGILNDWLGLGQEWANSPFVK